MMKRKYLMAAAAAVLLGTAFGAQAQDKEPVRIGTIAPLSGPGAFDGQLAVEGMEAMVEIVNENGGILDGRMIELVKYDDKGNPEEGVSAAKRAIEQDDVDAIVGGWFSSVALTMKEVTRDRIINVMTSTQHPNTTKEGHKYLFRLNATSVMMSETYAKFICDKMDIETIAFITINDDYGRLEVENYERLLDECGIEVLGNEFYNKDDTDFTTALTKLKALDSDAIYVSAINTAQGATIYRQIKQSGYKGTTIASAGNMNPKLVELSGPALEGVYSVSLFAPDSDSEKLKAWMEQYGEMFSNEPSFIGSLGAQAVELLAGAMDEAGSARDYDKIAEALRGHEWETILGTINFDEIGQAMQNIYLVQVKDGEITSVNE
ncbi:ABC transporter substrate-binding protein [Pseudohoeflea coraliihabitans]|uniref:ABC transporter substrate-binding protein n=1 Tax=Pseudohoeflea coraliihabitans TaxID=2860393 RepID=A0ABS6WKY4_9HYPH|nr:ABC transporter substrate-binding protein [Pseudohoeflea sp. DP4N28-3]MBW3096611.1 ABC transporter substrate-binding protein [Pseudohoeflea sp. DP4N28-3]